MVRVWLDETEQEIIVNALEAYKQDAQEDAQWTPFINMLQRLEDKIFHAGEDDE